MNTKFARLRISLPVVRDRPRRTKQVENEKTHYKPRYTFPLRSSITGHAAGLIPHLAKSLDVLTTSRARTTTGVLTNPGAHHQPSDGPLPTTFERKYVPSSNDPCWSCCNTNTIDQHMPPGWSSVSPALRHSKRMRGRELSTRSLFPSIWEGPDKNRKRARNYRRQLWSREPRNELGRNRHQLQDLI